MSDDLLNLEEILKDGEPCDYFGKVQKEIANSELPFPAGHESYFKRTQEVAGLMHQVVGAEVDIR